MKQALWGALCLCVLSLAQGVRADDRPPLGELTRGGSVGTFAGVAAGAGLTLGVTLISHAHEAGEFAGLGSGAVAAAISLVALPFCTAGGVKLAAHGAGYEVSYGRALGGASLGLATYAVFALPLLFPASSQKRKLVSWSLGIGAAVTALATMPLLSARLAQEGASHTTGAAQSPLGLGYTGSF